MKKELDLDLSELLDLGVTGGVDPLIWTYFDQLKNHRTIIFNDVIGNSVVEMVYCQLRKFEQDDDYITPVTLILNTLGGSVFDGLFLCNVIDNYSKPLNIICPGYCFSMGAIILSAGSKNPNVHKYCYPFSTVLYHAGDLNLGGESNSVKDTMAFSDKIDTKIKEYILSNTTIPENVYDEHNRKQWYLTSDEMLQYGLVDAILTKEVDA